MVILIQLNANLAVLSLLPSVSLPYNLIILICFGQLSLVKNNSFLVSIQFTQFEVILDGFFTVKDGISICFAAFPFYMFRSYIPGTMYFTGFPVIFN